QVALPNWQATGGPASRSGRRGQRGGGLSAGSSGACPSERAAAGARGVAEQAHERARETRGAGDYAACTAQGGGTEQARDERKAGEPLRRSADRGQPAAAFPAGRG